MKRILFKISCMICLLLLPLNTVSGFYTTQTGALSTADDYVDFTYRLTQSTPSMLIWTTLPAEKVYKNSPVPIDTGSEILVYAAKNEFEPFQIIAQPTGSGPVLVNVGSFGAGITTEMYQVDYVDIASPTDYLGQSGPNPDPLWPVENGASIDLLAGQNTPLWLTVHVPATTPSGQYTTSLTIGAIDIPVKLHIFDFTIPDQLHVKSQMNFSHQTVLSAYSVPGYSSEYWMYVDMMKQFFIDHRLTPKSALWPGGVTSSGGGPFIDYDCNGTLTDNYGIWGFEDPATKYLDGTAMNNGVGFPSYMAMTFQNNDPSNDQRPTSFCGQTRTSGDWYPANNLNTPYNQLWFDYVSTLEDYLQGLGYLDKIYHYVANEPQNQADYDAVAWYAQALKNAAPDIKLMVSEEPKPEIYDHPLYPGVKLDIWLPHWGIHYDPTISWDRQKNHGEDTWIYFLHNTYLPRFNPITIDHPSIEYKILGWFLWKYRIRGIAYWKFNDWAANPWANPSNYGQNGNLFLMYPPSHTNSPIGYGSNNHRFVPSIRLELIRDSLEDYEYFYLLNNGSQPEPFESNNADEVVDQIIADLAAYKRDSEMLYNLRRQVGLMVGGEISQIPEITPVSRHPRADGSPGNYYLNFQDPGGEPFGAVIFNGNNYIKVGNELYNAGNGYGWYKAAEVPASSFYTAWDQWVDTEPKALLASSVIDDWGRNDVFEFDLPNGIYDVTVGVGYRGGDRSHKIVIEGIKVIDGEITNNSWITRTHRMVIKDKVLSLMMGDYERIGFINFLDIEAAEPWTHMLFLPIFTRR